MGDLERLLVAGLCRILKEDSGIDGVDKVALSAFSYALSERLEAKVKRLREMAIVSGRTTVNIFDTEPLLKQYRTSHLISYLYSRHSRESEEKGDSHKPPTQRQEAVTKQATVRVIKRPPDYTFKRTATRAYRPDDPLGMQRARADQQHHVEEALRRHADREGLFPSFVNYDI